MKSKIALGIFVTVLCAWLVAPIMRIIHPYPPVNLPTERGAQRVAAIFIEKFSTDTYSNLEQAKRIIDQQGFVEVLLVSDRWHLVRAQMMARDLGMKVQAAPVRHSAFQSNLAQLEFVLREWVKTWAYCLGWRRNL